MTKLKKYIDTLVTLLDKNNIPKEIDLVIDGGSFNGSFGIGILLYLKAMEEANILKVRRISGCSVGSILGLMYITNNLDQGEYLIQETMKGLRNDLYLKQYSSIIETFISNNIRKRQLTMLKDKLYINTYSSKENKNIVISKYDSKRELIDIILQSCHIPYFMDKHAFKDNFFLDGVLIGPYLFKDSKKTLFIKLLTLEKMKYTIYIKNETNIAGRTLEGVLDINKFFSNSQSNMCSYIQDWNIRDFILFRSRNILCLVVTLLIDCGLLIHKYFPTIINESKYYKQLQEIIINLYKDIMYHIIL